MRMLLYDVRGFYLQGGTEHEGVSRVIKWTDCSTANSAFEKSEEHTVLTMVQKQRAGRQICSTGKVEISEAQGKF